MILLDDMHDEAVENFLVVRDRGHHGTFQVRPKGICDGVRYPTPHFNLDPRSIGILLQCNTTS